jgi:hypothetical protein
MALYDTLLSTRPIIITNSKTLSANNTAASVNLFQLTGSVIVRKIYGVLTAKTTLANMTVAQFALYDGTATSNITLPTGGTMSTAVVGAVIARNAAASVVAGINLAATGTVIDTTTTGSLLDSSFIITQKNSTNTYIQFKYTTTDAPINATMSFVVEYDAIADGALAIV